MIPIKSAHRTITEIQDLEAMVAKLLETAANSLRGRYATTFLRKLGVRITALKAKGGMK